VSKLNSILTMYGLEPAPDIEAPIRFSTATARLGRLEEEWNVADEPTEPAPSEPEQEPTDES